MSQSNPPVQMSGLTIAAANTTGAAMTLTKDKFAKMEAMLEFVERFVEEVAAAVDAERVVIMDSLQAQADLAGDELDREFALEMKAAVAARRIGVKKI